jgi:predicted O-methyltransferase YrrM
MDQVRWFGRDNRDDDIALAEANLREGMRGLDAGRTKAEPTQDLRLEYPVRAGVRWGYGRPAHPALEARIASGDSSYAGLLARCAGFEGDFARIPAATGEPGAPRWNNPYFFGLDAVALYAMLATTQPRTYLEIGSGFSTSFARRAISDHALPTRVVCVDPEPRAHIAHLADEIVLGRLEDLPAEFFDSVGPDDVVFLDGSHMSFMGSDVTVFFLDVLPRLPAGALIQVHDVFLPWDYRPDWTGRWYSEQYLLAAYLLAGDSMDIVLPAFYVYTQPRLASVLSPLWRKIGRRGYETAGHSFWFRRR